MRRRPNVLTPIEQAILEAASELRAQGEAHFHGFVILAKTREANWALARPSSGSLYTTLGRLERAGLLLSRWEDANVALKRGHPRRRLYQITAAGENARLSWHTVPARKGSSKENHDAGLLPNG